MALSIGVYSIGFTEKMNVIMNVWFQMLILIPKKITIKKRELYIELKNIDKISIKSRLYLPSEFPGIN